MKEVFYKGCICPACELGKLSLAKKERTFNYKNQSHIIIKQVWMCDECDNFFWQAKDSKSVEKELTDFRRKVDGLLTSDEIRSIRNMFGLTQVEFARVLRVADKNFARYEAGQATQSFAMDNLLRILMANPIGIKELPDWPKNLWIPSVAVSGTKSVAVDTPAVDTIEYADGFSFKTGTFGLN